MSRDMEKLVVSYYRTGMMHGWTHGRGVIAWERVQLKFPLKVCSHLTSAFAFASTSPSQFNIASMETQTQKHRIGLNPVLMFYIDAMLNIDANPNVKCEHTITVCQGFCPRGRRAWRGVCGGGLGHAWQILWDMVNERAVRILLECILV